VRDHRARITEAIGRPGSRLSAGTCGASTSHAFSAFAPSGEVEVNELKPKQRAFLRSKAHPLKPILQIGKDGVTHAVLQTITDAFHARELIKVRALESSPDPARQVGATIAEQLPGVHVVQVIGRTLVLYRRHPEKPELQLPA
jgi:RNA-binding protein